MQPPSQKIRIDGVGGGCYADHRKSKLCPDIKQVDLDMVSRSELTDRITVGPIEVSQSCDIRVLASGL